MAQTNTSGSETATDIEAVGRQLAALREDLAHLAETVSGIAGRRGRHLASDVAEGFDEARQYVGQKGRSAEHQLEASVADHPLLAIGLAACAGLFVGAMSRR